MKDMSLNSASLKRIALVNWTSRAKNHEALLNPFVTSFLKRRDLRKSHPVHDFLFTYYSFSPAKLIQWVPSIYEELEIADDTQEKYPWFQPYWFEIVGTLLRINPQTLTARLKTTVSFIANLCSEILNRPHHFKCFGLHEWAMVYKQPQNKIRHQSHPLRLCSNELSTFVESRSLCCTHYDAYRFFTPEARPLNCLAPTLESRINFEQGGCIHANMDLYKWANKLWPWIGSDFITKTFFLALEARELDMRASPYDLTSEGYSPILIETEEGRQEYQSEQKKLALKAVTLRKELLSFCRFLETLQNVSNIRLLA